MTNKQYILMAFGFAAAFLSDLVSFQKARLENPDKDMKFNFFFALTKALLGVTVGAAAGQAVPE